MAMKESTSKSDDMEVSLLEEPVAGLISLPAGSGNDGGRRPLASPSYEVLRRVGLLTTKFMKDDIGDLELRPPNTDKTTNWKQSMCWTCCLPPIFGACLYGATHTLLDVPPGHVQKMVDDKDNHIFAAPGMHNFGPWTKGGSISQVFWKSVGKPVDLTSGHIRHGDHNILTVTQGFVGLAWDRGEPHLFPPGMHEWTSDTLNFGKSIDLGTAAIPLGPYTLLTVDDGYAAVTQNNGKQVILQGGHVHFLNHRNWKFNHFISLKIKTDNLEKIQATSADNIIMQITSTVNWRIVDVKTAALMAAETMHTGTDAPSMSADISKLRKDVLKQAVASLASFIGSVNYSDSFHLAAAAQSSAAIGVPATSSEGRSDKDNPLFNRVQMKSAVEHANEVTSLYGVQVLSINVISADPVDKKLTTALASGAVASAEALQAETAARGNSRAKRIEAEAQAENSKILAVATAEAQAENSKILAVATAEAVTIKAGGEAEAELIKSKASAESELIKAKADAEAERLRAAGSKDAADMISGSEVAVDLAKMDKTSAVMGDKSKFFFGQEPGYLSNIVLKGAV
ncbi:hypothetical protein BSKO_05573 [Bryopsis sp. KO-2023]|nr:hypothetical protein BSKO_05573 [Bryopsis sp. KO-2023]